MPIYTTKCVRCGTEVEQFIRSFTPPRECFCGGELSIVFSPPSLYWSTGKNKISFENKRKFTQPHESNDARKRDYF